MTRQSSFEADLRCPRDGSLLKRSERSKVPYAWCRRCYGLWFDREAIESEFKAELPKESRQPRPMLSPTTEATCPRCGKTLHEELVDSTPIDLCATCGGVWLDPGEYPVARRRSARLRLERKLPSFRKDNILMRVVDSIFYLFEWIENDLLSNHDVEEEEAMDHLTTTFRDTRTRPSG